MPAFPSPPPAAAANPVTLGSFKTDLTTELGRGTSLASRIPNWLRTSVQWLEQNFTFEYMKKEYLLTLAVGENSIALPSLLVKTVMLVQPAVQNPDGSVWFYPEIPKVDPKDLVSVDIARPSGRWQTGQTLFFDSVPSEAIPMRVRYAEYSVWPTADAAQPELLIRYENLLRAQFMMTAWQALKDFEAAASWRESRDLALRTVLVAEDANEWEGQDIYMEPNG
jgi:hypothetical protein